MTYHERYVAPPSLADSIHAALTAFPVACFTLALGSDITYWSTLNLLWLHFSEWLLLAGLVGGGLDILARLVDRAVRKVRPSGWAILAGVAAMVLATVNSLVHTADGWTAVVPYGLILSALTVIAMVFAGWFARKGVRHV